ncbi:hypothetical protein BCR44DRAFT_48678 [Catenaria anguillulae PL171]|uniref:Invertebrate defensins family profile domain-containing protein n=1 Tax=Catenaria anguillulae PL171 TaxID=765915 RepID=A0A1Y2HPQ1_9FUNG|nr:hypothetical protein BCR44DRAFT_48678 [Catenaria anguillulae PL171]
MKASTIFALALLALGASVQAAPADANAAPAPVAAEAEALAQPESDIGIMGEFCIKDSCSMNNSGKCEQMCREHGGKFTRMEKCGWFSKRCCCKV